MIFSFSKESKSFSFPQLTDVDVFCFFKTTDSIICPHETLILSIRASLRLKRSVLILSDQCEEFPSWNKDKRWDLDNNWIWLAPRSLGAFSTISPRQTTGFQELSSLVESLN